MILNDLFMIPNGKGWHNCLNCLHSFRTKNKRESHNQHHKSDIAPFIIYADLEFLIEKIDVCKKSLQYSHLKTKKLSMMYIYIKIASESFENSYESTQ